MTRRAQDRTYHYIYKITRDDGKFYYGLHSTDNLDDGYFGSGMRLSRSIKKYGKDRHTKEIIEFLPSREAVKTREREIVNAELLKNEECMNLSLGGQGIMMTDEIAEKISTKKRDVKLSDSHKQKVSEALKGKKKPNGFGQKVSISLTGRKLSEDHKDACARSHLGKKLSDEHRKAQSEGRRGKPRSEEAKRKLSEYMKGKPNQSAKKLQKQCTIDGVTIYPSVRDLVLALGHGKTGVKSPSFRFI